MNPQNPILILQMQRMGDLVLTFPLVGWLQSNYPGVPIWVVGEKNFFEGLIEISPAVTYFSYSDSEVLRQREYSLLINLSHRQEAAALAGKLRAEKRIGPYLKNEEHLYISGDWQLYRSSINHNNRHNRLHWADLNALDVISPTSIARTDWPKAKPPVAGKEARVGLFVGASELEKRPDAEFWAKLTSRLMRQGAKPAILGGKSDNALAAATAGIVGIPAINLSGRFSIIQLCRFISQLDLLIVPDTGPMHIAAWVGVPVLNISVGPVNAWETGPFAPGHFVIRPSMSCSGCWSCLRKDIECKQSLKAERVALIASLLLSGKVESLGQLERSAGLIYHTRRDDYGLFDLQLLNNEHCGSRLGAKEECSYQTLRDSLGSFWKNFFCRELGFLPTNAVSEETRQRILDNLSCCRITPLALTSGKKILSSLSTAIQRGSGGDWENRQHWLAYPPFLRPLSSYIQLMLQNEDFSRASLGRSLELTEAFLANLRV